jgi:hypothetical protein
MADDRTTTRAFLETPETPDLEVEHRVKQHGISRPDILIQSNTNPEISADIAASQVNAVQHSASEAGAIGFSGRQVSDHAGRRSRPRFLVRM